MRNIKIRSWWALLVTSLLAANGLASDLPEVRADHRVGLRVFTSDDGLPQSGVNAVVQSGDGYLWIGTFGGLARFDGLTFTVFRERLAADAASPDKMVQSGPASDRILALHEDDEGQLWIGTQDAGLSVYRHGVFRHLPVCGGVCQINDIMQAPDRTLWIASNTGLFALERGHRRETWIDSGKAGHARLVRDGRGRVYVGGHDGFFVVAERRLRRIALPDGGARVQVLKNDGGELLVGTEHALYRYDPEHGRWWPLGVADPTAAVRDPDGRWWVALGSGQLVQEHDDGTWHDVPELFGMGITSLAWDDEGNLWIGSGSKGLLRVRRPLFGLVAAPTAGVNMAGRAVISDGGDGLWLGSACGGLRHWQPDGSASWRPVPLGRQNDCVTSLALDPDGTLWVGLAEGRVIRLKQGQPMPVGSWPASAPINVWRLDGGRVLVGSGCSTFELEVDADGRIVARHRIEALQGMTISSIVPAARGGDWFVGDHGVWRLIAGQVVERWTPREGLSSRFARALYEDGKAGALWVGTYGGGLNRIQDGRVHRYDSYNGLFDDTVSCILPDARGRLWLGGNRGVTLLPRPHAAAASIESIGYAASDGLIPAEINGGHSTPCHRDTRGRLWFSLVEGFAYIDPEDIPDAQPIALRPHIEEVAVAGRRQEITGSSLVLEPFARSLEIYYTAVNLSRPRDTRFRFRLRGFDRDWVEAGQNRSILYPSVPWGKHVFEVQARLQGGEWSAVSAELRIVNPQPWYLRPWVLILATSLSLLALVGATQFGAGQIGFRRGGSVD